MHDTATDRLAIRDLDGSAVRRDAGDRARFRTVGHDDGVMIAAWLQVLPTSHPRHERGLGEGRQHPACIGGPSIDVVAERAVAQTKMTISARSQPCPA